MEFTIVMSCLTDSHRGLVVDAAVDRLVESIGQGTRA